MCEASVGRKDRDDKERGTLIVGLGMRGKRVGWGDTARLICWGIK